MLMPLTEMASHDRVKALSLESWARERYGLTPDAGPARPALLRAAERAAGRESEIAALLGGPTPDWAELRTRLIAGIHAGATPERRDRLFPGDPKGFCHRRYGSGARGRRCPLRPPPRRGPGPGRLTDWLAETARRRDPAAPGGLYDGLPGTAVTLALLGRPDEGRELFARAAEAAHPSPLGRSAHRARGHRPGRRPPGRGDPGAPDPELLDTALRTAWDLDCLVRGETVPGGP